MLGYLTAATKHSCPYCVLSALVFDIVVRPLFLWSKPKIATHNSRWLHQYAVLGIGSTQSEGEPHY
jgi:hypothetical protein